MHPSTDVALDIDNVPRPHAESRAWGAGSIETWGLFDPRAPEPLNINGRCEWILGSSFAQNGSHRGQIIIADVMAGLTSEVHHPGEFEIY